MSLTKLVVSTGGCHWADLVEPVEPFPDAACDSNLEKSPSSDLSRFLNPESYYLMMDSSNFFVYGYDDAKHHSATPGYFDSGAEFESRTILISNIPDGLDPMHLYNLANETFGEVAQFDPQVSRGVVAIRFHDLRASRMMWLCSVRYRARFLNVMFGPPLPVVNRKKPPNNGTLVLFHLPPEVTDLMVRIEFGKFGEIRQIRETSHKPTQRFIEYWDSRHAEAAMKVASTRGLFRGKVAVEFSLPGGNRRETTPLSGTGIGNFGGQL